MFWEIKRPYQFLKKEWLPSMIFSEHFITALILSTLLGGYLIDSLAEYLNIQHLSPELPHEFSDVYDTDKYARSQEYLKVNTRFGFITESFDLVILLSFEIYDFSQGPRIIGTK